MTYTTNWNTQVKIKNVPDVQLYNKHINTHTYVSYNC